MLKERVLADAFFLRRFSPCFTLRYAALFPSEVSCLVLVGAVTRQSMNRYFEACGLMNVFIIPKFLSRHTAVLPVLSHTDFFS